MLNNKGHRKNVCKLISELVGADKQVVSEVFARLEKRSGEPGVDIRLTGEIYGKIHMKMRELGLDPSDTTPHELYQSLLNLAALHDKFLTRRLGIEDSNNSADILKAVVRLIEGLRLPKHAWVLKQTAAKRLLKAMPPKGLMKLLNYRSLDSMLKRESPDLLLAVARHTEPVVWQERFVQSYKKLESGDFETRVICTEFLSDKRWEGIAKLYTQSHRSNILHTPEVGVIAFLQVSTENFTGLALTSLLLTLHYINEIRVFSTYCKFHHMRGDFGTLLIEHILHQKQDHIRLAGQPLHWRIIHRYYGGGERMHHPEIFEPHVQPEDLAYRKAELILYHLEPALKFWHDLDYVGMSTHDGPISFSLTDMATNLVNHLPYEKRVYYHMQDALWNETCIRYTSQPVFEQHILQQLDEQAEFVTPVLPGMELVW